MGEYIDRLEHQRTSLNVACLIGHGTLRSCVMGFENRRPKPNELRRMNELAAQSMQEGAFGMSSGLFYVPGSYAKLDELVELCRTIRRFVGFYATHMRDQSDHLEEAVDETLVVARRANVPLEISHHKDCGKRNWGKIRKTLRTIAAARSKGVDVTVDLYPYLAYSTQLTAAMPAWAYEGGIDSLVERLRNSGIRSKLKSQMKTGLPNWESMTKCASWERFTISRFPGKPTLVGRTIKQIARVRRCDPFDAIFDMVIEGKESVDVLVEDMNEQDTQLVMKSPFSMIRSDGYSLTQEASAPTPESLEDMSGRREFSR